MNETAKTIRFHKTGGPDVLRVEVVRLPQLKGNEVLVRVRAIALSRMDLLSSMGIAAIQMAKALRAHSIAVTRSEGKKQDLVEAGADQDFLPQKSIECFMG